MPRYGERITLICQNPRCPRPWNEFSVTVSERNRKHCSSACSHEHLAIQRAKALYSHPTLTPRQFIWVADQFETKAVLRAAAWQVLVDGCMMMDVVRATGVDQRSLSKVVKKYRMANE